MSDLPAKLRGVRVAVLGAFRGAAALVNYARSPMAGDRHNGRRAGDLVHYFIDSAAAAERAVLSAPDVGRVLTAVAEPIPWPGRLAGSATEWALAFVRDVADALDPLPAGDGASARRSWFRRWPALSMALAVRFPALPDVAVVELLVDREHARGELELNRPAMSITTAPNAPPVPVPAGTTSGPSTAPPVVHPDGPCPPRSLWWQGKEHLIGSKKSQREFRLLAHIYDRELASFDELQGADKPWPDYVSDSTIKSAVSRLNSKLPRTFPWRWRVQGRYIVKEPATSAG